MIRALREFGHRLAASFRTNEPQATMVFCLTALNGIALLKRTGETPMWLIIGALAFWPLLAWLHNLESPIPERTDEN